ncbi:MAG TPA: flagellar basal-body rod protein FlgF [Polyangiales bacterium]|nr:flagellar basal-body rod protein FlgF [Polyangiales bacterium]
MSDGIYSALSGALAQERNLQVTANNVANANTAGFKADRPSFYETLTKVKNPQALAPSLRYVHVADVQTDHGMGSFRLTERPLDVALQGDGFFTIETPKGERYTRAGSFVIDHEGTLRTLGGQRVMGENGPLMTQKGREIKVPQNTREVAINPDGSVRADNVEIGKLKLVRFADAQQDLIKDGLTWFTTQNDAQPLQAEPTTTCEQGYLEDANINPVQGMTELIVVQRSFEALQKVIETFRDLDSRTARDVAGRS